MRARPEPHLICPRCAHRWRAPEAASVTAYADLSARNAMSAAWVGRKFAERAAAIAPLLRDGQRLLEIGCAEGELGRRLKQGRDLHYCGVELSRDADAAARTLDRVHCGPAATLEAEPFDGVIAFHVLEHIAQLDREIDGWRRVLAPDGWLLIEVPNRAGHPDLEWDTNPEHLHQFSLASLAALLIRCALAPVWITGGHFESPAYSDSLRVLARQVAGPLGQRDAMLARIRRRLPNAFLVRGSGGDFRKFLAPLADALPIAGVLGTNDGERTYDPQHDAQMPILVCSLRFEDEIVRDLAARGHPAAGLVRLSELLQEGA